MFYILIGESVRLKRINAPGFHVPGVFYCLKELDKD